MEDTANDTKWCYGNQLLRVPGFEYHYRFRLGKKMSSIRSSLFETLKFENLDIFNKSRLINAKAVSEINLQGIWNGQKNIRRVGVQSCECSLWRQHSKSWTVPSIFLVIYLPITV